MRLSLELESELINKVNTYAKIISGQSAIYKTTPPFNLNDIRKQYITKTIEEYKGPRLSQTLLLKYATKNVDSIITYVLDSINK